MRPLHFIPLLFMLGTTVPAAAQTTLRLRGSDTLGAKLLPQMAEAFKKQAGKVSFDIAAEGSSTAFTNLLTDSAEIGMSSRKVKPDEGAEFRLKGRDLREFEIAWDVIVIIVNKDNPVSDLKKKQVLQYMCSIAFISCRTSVKRLTRFALAKLANLKSAG